MPLIKTFCGHQLDAGARVAAFYTILFSFLMVGRGYWYLKQINDLETVINYNKMYSDLLAIDSSSTNDKYEKYRLLFPIAVSFICFGVLFFIVSILLFHSGFKKNKKWVWLWIIIIGIGIGYFFVLLIYYGFIADTPFPEVEAVLGLILLFVMIYFYIIACSYKQWISATGSEVCVTQEYVIEPSLALQPRAPNIDLPPAYSEVEPRVTTNISIFDSPPQYSDISKC